MFQTAVNIFKVPELRRKIFFTIGMLAIFRVGEFIPLPGVNQVELAEKFGGGGAGTLGQLFSMISMFSGGNLGQSTLFGLGIMPYISASIIFQLLATVIPSLEKLQKEGDSGRKKINEYTRYATVGLCIVQAAFWLRFIHGSEESASLVYPEWRGTVAFWSIGILGLTAGTIFLMWLGEQMDEYGVGNGISLVIMAGIVARMPAAVYDVASRTTLDVTSSGDTTKMTLPEVLVLVASFLFVIAGSILITQAQRRIPIQQAKQVKGRRLYGGQRQYLPLRVNHAGVMPIIFASSLMIFPNLIIEGLNSYFDNAVLSFLAQEMQIGAFLYIVLDMAMIIFFCYFWTSVQFQPKEMARQLQDYGSFVPGLRPGKRTADYLEKVMERITYVGAGFLCAIAIIPTVAAQYMGINQNVAQFLGGTGLLIVVSVALDLVQRIEASLTMHHYGGFLGSEGKVKGAYA